MGLKPLEFSESLTDSPWFRESLHEHEKELERTSKAIKSLINECKELVNAAKNLSKAQRSFSTWLTQFKFECIESGQTDDERVIAGSLQEFGKLISAIEDERERMLERAYDQFIQPLEKFRKEQIGGAKVNESEMENSSVVTAVPGEGERLMKVTKAQDFHGPLVMEKKKKFDKETLKFCQNLERNLNLKTKTNDSQLQEADASLEMEQRHFFQASMQYVVVLQEVQERKKFEFVETLLGFMYGWLTFYHQGHEVHKDFQPYMTDLQIKIQKTRENFDATKVEANHLMQKMLEKPQEALPPISSRSCTRQGYLFSMEKKALGTTWTKYYCQYQKENRIFTMIPYNQVITGKGINTETMVVSSCTRRATDSIEKRFCFDLTIQDRPCTLTLQALSDGDWRQWLDAMDGKEPIYSQPGNSAKEQERRLDPVGFEFVKKCVKHIEAKGLKDQGLYRVVGVSSKVNKLISLGLDRRKSDKKMLDDLSDYEVKTVTSALKSFFRTLPEPMMTFKLHYDFLTAAKQELKTSRINDVHMLVHKLPKPNYEMLEILIKHLTRVAAESNVNLMSPSNLGVCFGPTLMRSQEETMAAIMDIKFCNIVVEILIENYEKIFNTTPPGMDNKNQAPILRSNKPALVPKPQSMALGQIMGNTSPTATSPASSTLSTVSNVAPTFNSTNSTPTPVNQNQTYAQFRAKLRPTGSGLYNQFSPGTDHQSSTSSSSESLNSKCSSTGGNHLTTPTSATVPIPEKPKSISQPLYGNQQILEQGGSVPKPGDRHSQLPSTSSSSSGNKDHARSSSTSSVSSLSSGAPSHAGRRKVRTLYACEAENDSELSFEPNQIIYNVRPSREPGWLEGSLDGRIGLIPANYVEYLN